MSETVVIPLSRFHTRIKNDLKKLAARTDQAITKSIQDAVPIVRKRTPRAFGNLQGSIHAEHRKLVVSAPHAGAVEQGSPPHMPDIEALTEWVKLRGLQFQAGRLNKRSLGPTTRYQATRVGQMLKAERRRGTSNGFYHNVDAPRQVALRIAKQIAEHGTRPHWYVRSSLYEIRNALEIRLRRVFKK